MGRAVILASVVFVALTQASTDPHDEYDYQKAVDSDKKKLETSIDTLTEVTKDYRKAAENRTHAQKVAARLADEVFREAADDATQDKQKAMNDFNSALTTLKSSTAGQYKDAEKAVRQKSREVERLEKQEKEDALKRLHSKGRAEKDRVHKTVQEAKDAFRQLQDDRHHLVKAMRRAGRGEHGTHGYETVDHDLEHYAERRQNDAERQNDKTADAIEHVFENAHDNLEHREERTHEAASHQRNRAIQEVVDVLIDLHQESTQQTGVKQTGAEQAELDKMNKQMKSLTKNLPPSAAPADANKALFAVPLDARCVSFFAAGSLGLLTLFLFVRRTRPASIQEPLLRTW